MENRLVVGNLVRLRGLPDGYTRHHSPHREREGEGRGARSEEAHQEHHPAEEGAECHNETQNLELSAIYFRGSSTLDRTERRAKFGGSCKKSSTIHI